ncbi:DUF5666 domain-containing protein [Roseobacter sp.]|uniref:DUF5666 domain-containing protein n=1 Tax=Roseobacter sp. TaxID=1907202 RepID=UPI0029672896|nr:DUF5666 domain-containing protein [Roseobacter sp.]MDW3183526.1 DUF5666 domain-containing protein [Roseobacter sp.]
MTTGKLSRRAALAAGLSGLMLPGTVWSQSAEREVEGGIGGTGIVGVLTDFGSLIVGGNRVQTDAATGFSDGFGGLREEDVQIGDSLTVEAMGAPDALVARRVHVTHPLVGRISAASEDERRVTINGVEVVTGSPDRGFVLGDRVAVSGLWQGTRVMASRLTAARSDLDLISGDVKRSAGDIRLGTVSVRGRGVGALPQGSFASAAGRYDADTGRFRVDRLSTQRFIGAAGPLARLSIEGYLEPTDTAPGYRISGLGHSFERTLDLQRYAEARVRFSGAYTGRFAADSAVILPEAAEARRRLLRRLSR